MLVAFDVRWSLIAAASLAACTSSLEDRSLATVESHAPPVDHPASACEPCVAIEDAELLWFMERRCSHEPGDGSSCDAWGRCVENVGDVDGDRLDDLVVFGAAREFERAPVELIVDSTPKGVTFHPHGATDLRADELRCVARLGDLSDEASGGFVVGGATDPGMSCGARGDLWKCASWSDSLKLRRPERVGLCGDDYALDVADAGDVDGDGVRDVAVVSVGPDAGSYILSGLDGRRIRALPFEGTAVVAGRDLDGDGVPDIAISNVAREGRFNVGFVWILPGDVDRAPECIAAPLDHERFGHALAWVEDIDGDGAAELAIGAPDALDQRGALYVFSGARRTLIRSWTGEAPGALFGSCLSSDHDLSGDGVRDLVVGAPGLERRDSNRSVVVLDPKSGAVLLRIEFGVTCYGADPAPDGLRFGGRWHPMDYASVWRVATAQLDGDGLPEIVVGAPQWGPHRRLGTLYAVSGAFVRRCIESAR